MPNYTRDKDGFMIIEQEPKLFKPSRSLRLFINDLVNRLFYRLPKKCLIGIFHWLVSKHKHLAHLIFDNLLPDVVYYTKSHNKPEATEAMRLYPASHAENYEPGFINDMQLRHQKPFVDLVKHQIEKKGYTSIADIGCANGFILDGLAKQYPTIQCFGLDFKTPPTTSHVTFLEGYPLETMQFLPKIDMVISTSTMLLCVPKELDAYIKRFAEMGVKCIAINDTQINGLEQKDDHKIWSKHMGYNFAWCHNYSGYLHKYGYKITIFRRTQSDHPGRIDHYILDIIAKKV